MTLSGSLLCSDTLLVQRVDFSSINVNIPIKPLCVGFYVIKASYVLLFFLSVHKDSSIVFKHAYGISQNNNNIRGKRKLRVIVLTQDLTSC